jgi:putative ABC transport system ATP-binding protein
MMTEPVLMANRLFKTYRRGGESIPALRGVSLSVQPGEFVAIVGRSGSGKSTLLGLLGGLDSPTQGEVRIGGTRLSELKPSTAAVFRRDHIGFLFQAVDLLPTLTILENVALPNALKGEKAAIYTERALSLLNALRLGHLANGLPDQLSGGERQRVGLARALVNRPEIILADEPTGSLDQMAGQSVVDLLKQVTTDYRAALILVTHDGQVASAADRLLTMQDGQLEG